MRRRRRRLLHRMPYAVSYRRSQYHFHQVPRQIWDDSGHEAWSGVRFICKQSQTVPNRYAASVPITIPANCMVLFPPEWSAANPQTAAVNMNPIKYPPVGPASLDRPPVNPEKQEVPLCQAADRSHNSQYLICTRVQMLSDKWSDLSEILEPV